MQQHRIESESELQKIVDALLSVLQEREDRGCAAVLALHGDLGAGKTTFMQILGRTLGVHETITSPTFVVMKKYKTTHERFSQLVHIDAYRIESVDEMRPLQFEAELGENGSIIGIEWAEHIAALLPPETIHINIALEDEARMITIDHGKTD